MEEQNLTCVNACSNKEMCFMLKPYFTCGHVMCFNSGMAINWCIQCGCKSKNIKEFNKTFNELLVDNKEQQPNINTDVQQTKYILNQWS